MKAALSEFADHVTALDLPHAGGLLLCGSEVAFACSLTPSFALFAQRSAAAVAALHGGGDAKGGATRLYDALIAGAASLAHFAAAHPGCACRILALTDGEDTSGGSAAAALAALTRHGVTLDAVLLCGRVGTLAAMAAATGGAWVRPESEADALAVFRREAFLSLAACRAAGADAALMRLPAAQQQQQLAMMDDKALQRAAWALRTGAADDAARDARAAGLGLRDVAEAAAAERDAHGAGGDAAAELLRRVRPGGLALALASRDALAPARLTAELSARARTLAAAAHAAPQLAHASSSAASARSRRLAAEMAALARLDHFHDDIQILVSDTELASWHLVITAPPAAGLLYDGGAWHLLAVFPDAYPSAPPAVYGCFQLRLCMRDFA
jgi:hypothetical protein